MKNYIFITALFLSLSSNAQEIKWYSFEEAVTLSKTAPRPILVDVYTDWCGYCKVMDKNTFANAIIANYVNDTYYPVKFNAEQKENVTFNQQTYKFVPSGNRGYHELAAALLSNKMSYPSVVFLDKEVRIIHVQKGFVQPEPFDEIIKFIGGGHYLSTAWEEWKKGYTSPFEKN